MPSEFPSPTTTMLRAAFRTASAARPWTMAPRSAATRWARYNSSAAGATPEQAGPSKQSEKAQAKPVAPTAEAALSDTQVHAQFEKTPTESVDGKPAEVAQAATEGAALSDKQVDAQLNDALLAALQEMQLEVKDEEAPLVVKGFEEPVFEALPPTNSKYDPVKLPIKQEPDHIAANEEEWHASLVHGRSSLEPYQHKPIYRIPAASLHLRSHHPKLLDFFCHFVSHAAASLGIPISKVAHLPTQRSLWTVPRSPFAHKKSQENFERRTHKRAIKAWDTDPEVIDRWFQYIRQHAMGGVGMRAIRWDRMQMSVGATRLQHVKQALSTPQQEIQKLAEKIVKEESKKVASS